MGAGGAVIKVDLGQWVVVDVPRIVRAAVWFD